MVGEYDKVLCEEKYSTVAERDQFVLHLDWLELDVNLLKLAVNWLELVWQE